jgi:CheY-like chemotaxis protein
MKILIIEDNDIKAQDIINSLAKLGYTDTVRTKSRNGGLRTFVRTMKSDAPFDFVITDNCMPVFDDTFDCKPWAAQIIKEIRRYGYDTPVCVCSSEAVEPCDNNYCMIYDGRTDISESLDLMLTDAAAYRKLTANETE